MSKMFRKSVKGGRRRQILLLYVTMKVCLLCVDPKLQYLQLDAEQYAAYLFEVCVCGVCVSLFS